MVKYLNSNSINGRGRRPSMLSKISAHFIKKNGKPENAEKFADDKARILALELANYTYLQCLDKSCIAELKNIMASKWKTQSKSAKIIKAISINTHNWLLLKDEFKKPSNWKDRLQVILKIKYNDIGDEKENIFNQLIEELFSYLVKKSLKNYLNTEPPISECCSTDRQSILMKSHNNYSDSIDTGSFLSGDDFLAIYPDKPNLVIEKEKKQPNNYLTNSQVKKPNEGQKINKCPKVNIQNIIDCKPETQEAIEQNTINNRNNEELFTEIEINQMISVITNETNDDYYNSIKHTQKNNFSMEIDQMKVEPTRGKEFLVTKDPIANGRMKYKSRQLVESMNYMRNCTKGLLNPPTGFFQPQLG